MNEEKIFFFYLNFFPSHSAIAHVTKSPEPSIESPLDFLNPDG